MENNNDLERYWELFDCLGLKRIINVAGTTTSLGSSVCSSKVRSAADNAMQHFASIHELQAIASDRIAQLAGSEAGCLTASASAGITLAVAGCITGLDPARAENLPQRPGEKCEVAIQLGHMCGYGAPVSQAIELAGATVVPVGQATQAADYQLKAALGPATAAAVYVISHHAVHYGQIPLKRFCEMCAKAGVPVIADAASEYDLRGFQAAGADLVICSGHKYLGGPTAGIIAGRMDLVKAAYLQNLGIGRGMKIGKESIAGTIAAIDQWLERPHEAIRRKERETLEAWSAALEGIDGVTARIVPDPTGNPIERLQVDIDAAQLGLTAAAAARILSEQDPAIMVRSHEVDLGYFQLDPCNLIPGQDALVAAAVSGLLREPRQSEQPSSEEHSARNAGARGYLEWLNQKS